MYKEYLYFIILYNICDNLKAGDRTYLPKVTDKINVSRNNKRWKLFTSFLRERSIQINKKKEKLFYVKKKERNKKRKAEKLKTCFPLKKFSGYQIEQFSSDWVLENTNIRMLENKSIPYFEKYTPLAGAFHFHPMRAYFQRGRLFAAIFTHQIPYFFFLFYVCSALAAGDKFQY